jgi:hypothetical protein
MGLDQYLSAKKFLSPAEWRGDESKKQFEEIVSVLDAEKYLRKDFPNAEVSISVGYWRKENAIHNWFVQNCQSGEDDCKEYHVDREQLETLKSVCETILLDKKLTDTDDLAQSMLPSQGGFFFGSTDYDEWYYRGLEDTISIIEGCLKMENSWEFYYQSSW